LAYWNYFVVDQDIFAGKCFIEVYIVFLLHFRKSIEFYWILTRKLFPSLAKGLKPSRKFKETQ
jgi:hypothetical protein